MHVLFYIRYHTAARQVAILFRSGDVEVHRQTISVVTENNKFKPENNLNKGDLYILELAVVTPQNTTIKKLQDCRHERICGQVLKD